MAKTEQKTEIPIWEKTCLTIEEAAEYTGVGRNKLRQISDDDRCSFVLWIGNRRLLKRKMLEEYLNSMYSI